MNFDYANKFDGIVDTLVKKDFETIECIHDNEDRKMASFVPNTMNWKEFLYDYNK